VYEAFEVAEYFFDRRADRLRAVEEELERRRERHRKLKARRKR
jgi:hypothetical protein